MSQLKAAVFSCKGLGDGLVSLVVSNNLHLNGWEVTTYHNNSLDQLQNWFSHLKIKPFLSTEEIFSILSEYDKIIISYDGSDLFIKKLIVEGKKNFFDKVYVLNPCPSKKIGKQPFYYDALFDPSLCMVDNMKNFCKNILQLPNTTKSNGMTPPFKNIVTNKNSKKICIHPTSAKPSKNWSKEKYVKLALHFQKQGYSPVFVISDKEKKLWVDVEGLGLEIKAFSCLQDLAEHLNTAKLLVGNDSGLGHLASCLDIPTVSIFRNYRGGMLWHPGWNKNIFLSPSKIIPNIRGFRLRDKKWQYFISVNKVLKACNSLLV